MRKLRNTLYITQEDTFVHREGETIFITKNHEKILQMPVHNLEGIVFFTHTAVTPQVLELCSSAKVYISYISHNSRFLVKIQNPVSGNIALRRSQFRIAESENQSLYMAKNFCIGKVFNSRVVLQRLLRDHKDIVDADNVEKAVTKLGQSMKNIARSSSKQELLGIEGDSAKIYYSVFNELILNRDNDFAFKGRSRRPPLDAVNALLSFFYVLLSHEVEAALESVGLDPQMGFYHQIRSGRSSLALDMMEELRAYIVDRFVVSLINNEVVNKDDFFVKEGGAVLLKDTSRSKLLIQWQNRKKDMIMHPFIKEKIEIGLIPYSQSLLLARSIRGDLDEYPPFLMR